MGTSESSGSIGRHPSQAMCRRGDQGEPTGVLSRPLRSAGPPIEGGLDNRDDIRDFLATRRAKLTPADVGLPTSARRRVPGLRREGVAVLAGVSTEWYTKLEKGHFAGVSEEVLAAVGELELTYQSTEIPPRSAGLARSDLMHRGVGDGARGAAQAPGELARHGRSSGAGQRGISASGQLRRSSQRRVLALGLAGVRWSAMSEELQEADKRIGTVETADGARLQWASYGEGPGLVLIAGQATTHLSWLHVLPQLARRRRVVVFDHRGVGRSTPGEPDGLSTRALAQDTLAVMTDAGLERADV